MIHVQFRRLVLHIASAVVGALLIADVVVVVDESCCCAPALPLTPTFLLLLLVVPLCAHSRKSIGSSVAPFVVDDDGITARREGRSMIE